MFLSFFTPATHMRQVKPKVFYPSDWDEQPQVEFPRGKLRAAVAQRVDSRKLELLAADDLSAFRQEAEAELALRIRPEPGEESAERAIRDLLAPGDISQALRAKDLRIYTSLIDDPVHAGAVVAAMKAGAPRKPLPTSLRWALSHDDKGRCLLSAARVLLGAVESVLERVTPGDGRRFLDELRDQLAGEASELGDAGGHDPGRAAGSGAS